MKAQALTAELDRVELRRYVQARCEHFSVELRKQQKSLRSECARAQVVNVSPHRGHVWRHSVSHFVMHVE